MAPLPTRKEYINSLKPVEHTGDCSICSEQFTSEHPAVKLECGHMFGHKCLTTWFESGLTANTCPMCRRTLFHTAPAPYNAGNDSSTQDGEDIVEERMEQLVAVSVFWLNFDDEEDDEENGERNNERNDERPA